MTHKGTMVHQSFTATSHLQFKQIYKKHLHTKEQGTIVSHSYVTYRGAKIRETFTHKETRYINKSELRYLQVGTKICKILTYKETGCINKLQICKTLIYKAAMAHQYDTVTLLILLCHISKGSLHLPGGGCPITHHVVGEGIPLALPCFLGIFSRLAIYRSLSRMVLGKGLRSVLCPSSS